MRTYVDPKILLVRVPVYMYLALATRFSHTTGTDCGAIIECQIVTAPGDRSLRNCYHCALIDA